MKSGGKINFLVFLFSASILLIFAPLFQQGVFIDGLLYKTVAHNFYWDEATFWRMRFNDVAMNPFYEQPPLYFFITGTLFKIFGTSLLADRSLTLLFFVLSILLLKKITSLFFKEHFFPMVAFFLLSISVFQWTYANQVIETLVLPLTLFAFLSAFKFCNTISATRWIWVLTFIICEILLFLTKGFQSCFSIITPFLLFCFYRDKKIILPAVVSYLVFGIVLYYVLYQFPPSAEWFHHYLNKRLLASINDVGATAAYRAEIIVRTITELIVPIIVGVLAYTLYRKKHKDYKTQKNDKQQGWFFLLIGIAGSFPFAITMEQRGFYLVPCFPFYILSLISFFREPLLHTYEKIIVFFNSKVLRGISLALVVLSLAYWALSPTLYKRDKNVLEDLAVISSHLQTKDTISVDEVSWNDLKFQAYLYMQSKVNVESNYTHRFYIRDKEHATIADTSYREIRLPTQQYVLYEKK